VPCFLRFDSQWYLSRRVQSRYIGHPQFDELAAQQLNAAFVEEQQDKPGTIIGLLPGSRNQELDRNLSTLIRAAAKIHEARPDARFLVACHRPDHRRRVEKELDGTGLPVAAFDGRTDEIIHLAHACV